MQEGLGYKAELRRRLTALGYAFPSMLAVGITWRYFPPWWPLLPVGCLLLAAYDYRLLWRYPAASDRSSESVEALDIETLLREYSRWSNLHWAFWLNSFAGIFLLVLILGNAVAWNWLHYHNQAVEIVVSAGVGILFPFILFLMLTRKRQDLYADDHPPEVKEAFRDAARGWGMTAQEAWRRGRSEGSVVVILGSFSIAASAIGAPHFFPPSKLEDFGFFLLFAGLAALGVGLFYYFFRVPGT